MQNIDLERDLKTFEECLDLKVLEEEVKEKCKFCVSYMRLSTKNG